ncbi:hypothetical protein D1007_26037 [Hordeum vulgare]|nr:hypothetical protein D1007_26037 [Hordeum vulgare]
MCANPHILEQLLAIEVTVYASHEDIATWLVALYNSSCCFLEGFASAFDDEYELISERAHVLLCSKAVMLVSRHAHATHHYEESTHDVEASSSSKPIIIDISDDKELLVFLA